MKKVALKILAAGTGLALCTSAVAQVAMNSVDPSAGSEEGGLDPQQVAGLADKFRAILAGFSVDSAQQDIEAALVFEADQSGLPQDVITEALSQVLIGQQSRVASNALSLIIRAQRRAAGQGTGALSGTEALDYFGDDTGPALVLGGGADSDYSF